NRGMRVDLAEWDLLLPHLVRALGGSRVATIRSCGSEDFPAVLDLLRQHWPNEVFDEATLRGVFGRGLLSPRQRYVCAELRSRVVGFAALPLKTGLTQDGTLGRRA